MRSLAPLLQELERALKECQQRLAKAEKDLAASQERKGQLQVRVDTEGSPVACPMRFPSAAPPYLFQYAW